VLARRDDDALTDRVTCGIWRYERESLAAVAALCLLNPQLRAPREPRLASLLGRRIQARLVGLGPARGGCPTPIFGRLFIYS
jgi:hypothetical protein